MKSYVLSIVGAVLLSAVMSMIIPNGKIGKHIQGVGKLLVVLFLISPIITFIHDRTFSFQEGDLKYDQSYLETSAVLASEREAERIKIRIEEEYSIEIQVAVTRSADGSYRLEKILVKVVDFGINDLKNHIDIMTQMQNELRLEYACEIEVTT